MIIITKNRAAATWLAQRIKGQVRDQVKIYTDKEHLRGLDLQGQTVFALFAGGGEMRELVEQAIAQRGTVYWVDDSPMREHARRIEQNMAGGA